MMTADIPPFYSLQSPCHTFSHALFSPCPILHTIPFPSKRRRFNQLMFVVGRKSQCIHALEDGGRGNCGVVLWGVRGSQSYAAEWAAQNQLFGRGKRLICGENCARMTKNIIVGFIQKIIIFL